MSEQWELQQGGWDDVCFFLSVSFCVVYGFMLTSREKTSALFHTAIYSGPVVL